MKTILMNEDDSAREKAYQAARATAHQLADKTKANYCVIDNIGEGDEEYAVLIEAEVPGNVKVWYVARPNTTTYLQYKAEANQAGVSVMPYKEWVASGRLSYSSQVIQEHGEEKGREKLSKSKVKTPKRKAVIRVDHIGEPSVDMPTRGKTKLVWEIADGLVVDGVSAVRSVIIETCLAAGINKGTAATQYSAWVRARREAK